MNPFGEEAYVAYYGRTHLKGCIDSHKTGLRIQFCLEREEDYEMFKGFKKRRKGKAGSGVYRMIYRMYSPDRENREAWQAPVEVRFVSWTLSSSSGAVITLELEDHEVWAWFRGSNAVDEGYAHEQLQLLEILMVEMDTEGNVVNVQQRDKLEKLRAKKKWPKGGPLSVNAGRLCSDPDFQLYLNKTYGVEKSQSAAAEFVRNKAGLDTRAQLDHDEAALQRYEETIKRPFLRWLEP